MCCSLLPSVFSFAHYFLNPPPNFNVRLKCKFFKLLSSIILCVSLGDSVLLYFLLKFLFYFLSLYFNFFFFLKSFHFKFSAALLPHPLSISNPAVAWALQLQLPKIAVSPDHCFPVSEEQMQLVPPVHVARSCPFFLILPHHS